MYTQIILVLFSLVSIFGQYQESGNECITQKEFDIEIEQINKNFITLQEYVNENDSLFNELTGCVLLLASQFLQSEEVSVHFHTAFNDHLKASNDFLGYMIEQSLK